MNGIRSVSRSFSNAANAGDVAGEAPSVAGHVLRRPAVGHDDDHRHGLLVGVEVVEDHVRRTAARPLVLVAADAVQQVEHGILGHPWSTPAACKRSSCVCPADLGFIFDHFHLAAVDAVAFGIVALGGRGKGCCFVLGVCAWIAQGQQDRTDN